MFINLLMVPYLLSRVILCYTYAHSRGGYSSMIWVGTCCWDLKSRPIFIPNFAEKLARATNFKQNLLKMSHFFPKLLSFQANIGNLVLDWWNWAYFGANLRKFWKYDPCLYQFLHWIRGHRYTRRLILRPISTARPRIDLCTKNPPVPIVLHVHTDKLLSKTC